MRTLSARFAGNSTLYSYFIPDGDEPKVGDIILTSVFWKVEETVISMDDVDTPVRTLGWGDRDVAREQLTRLLVAKDHKLATVVEIDDEPAGRADKFYVALLPADVLIGRREANRRLLEKARRERAIMAKLDALLAKEDKTARYASLAARNPEAAALMRELGLLPPAQGDA